MFTTKKKQIDSTGGTTYSIASISELLSVPYALHAKTAESITGSGSGSSGHYVGELFGGGVVCWVDHTGQHGRILSMVDLTTTGKIWSNVSQVTQTLGTTNDWDGAANTAAIIGQSGHTSSASKLCADYTNADYGTGTYSDWYLPSIAELTHVWNNIYEIQKPLTLDGNSATKPLKGFILDMNENDVTKYWSSSALPIKGNAEGYEYTMAWAYDFVVSDSGLHFGITGGSVLSEYSLYNVRAMRVF